MASFDPASIVKRNGPSGLHALHSLLLHLLYQRLLLLLQLFILLWHLLLLLLRLHLLKIYLSRLLHQLMQFLVPMANLPLAWPMPLNLPGLIEASSALLLF